MHIELESDEEANGGGCMSRSIYVAMLLGVVLGDLLAPLFLPKAKLWSAQLLVLYSAVGRALVQIAALD